MGPTRASVGTGRWGEYIHFLQVEHLTQPCSPLIARRPLVVCFLLLYRLNCLGFMHVSEMAIGHGFTG
jgi:hypothetical protein